MNLTHWKKRFFGGEKSILENDVGDDRNEIDNSRGYSMCSI